MTASEWKAASKPLYTRLSVLEAKAEDNGLTDTERAEHERLVSETDRLLKEFVRGQFEQPTGDTDR